MKVILSKFSVKMALALSLIYSGCMVNSRIADQANMLTRYRVEITLQPGCTISDLPGALIDFDQTYHIDGSMSFRCSSKTNRRVAIYITSDNRAELDDLIAHLQMTAVRIDNIVRIN